MPKQPVLDEQLVKSMAQMGYDANDPEKGALLKATMDKLDSILQSKDPVEAILRDLHPLVRGRVETLRDLQDKYDDLEDKFITEQRELVLKYERLYQPLYDERKAIVGGQKDGEIAAWEPTDEDEEGGDQPAPAPQGEAGAGIPEFWAYCLRNNDVVGELITEKDDDVLRYLKDIRYELLGADEPVKKDGDGDDGADEEEDEEDEEEPMGFKLYFEFEKGNPYFENDVLEKTYLMVDEDEGILEKSVGSTILWRPGKNVTVKTMRKKNKKKGRSGPPMTKTEKCESFFNFFSPPDPEELFGMDEEDEEDVDEEEMEALQEALQEDYEIGAVIKDKIIPHAVSWFTGEALMEEEESGEEEEGSGEEDEDGEDDGGARQRQQQVRAQSNSGASPSEGEQPECKQQ